MKLFASSSLKQAGSSRSFPCHGIGLDIKHRASFGISGMSTKKASLSTTPPSRLDQVPPLKLYHSTKGISSWQSWQLYISLLCLDMHHTSKTHELSLIITPLLQPFLNLQDVIKQTQSPFFGFNAHNLAEVRPTQFC